MTGAEIRAAIAASPELQALAAAGDTQGIADALSVGRTRLASRYITERGVIATLGTQHGEAFLQALEAFGTATLPDGHPLKADQAGIKRVLGWLKSGEGIELGDAQAQTLLGALGSVGVVNASHAATIAALARVADPVSEWDVRVAVVADDGSIYLGA